MTESIRRPFADIGQEGSPRTLGGKRTTPSSSKKHDPAVKAFTRKSPLRKKQRESLSSGGSQRLTRSAAKRMGLTDLDEVVDKVKRNLQIDENVDVGNAGMVLRTPSPETNSASKSSNKLTFSSSSDDDDNTVSMEAFNAMLAEARSDCGDSPTSHSRNGDNDDTMFHDSDDEGNNTSNRRNTASPSMLRAMMEMSDSEEEDNEISQAEQRGIVQAKSTFANRASSIGGSITDLPDQLSGKPNFQGTPEQAETVANSPVTQASLARFSMVSPPANQVRYNPTPLKSCLSSRKAPRDSTAKKKSIRFGSPKAAEFDLNDPVRGGVTPMRNEVAKSRFLMEEREDEVRNEDEATALNSSILSTWEEEENEDSESTRTSLSSNSVSGSGRRRRSSVGSSRRNSLRRSPRQMAGQRENADEFTDEPHETKDIQDRNKDDTVEIGELNELLRDSPSTVSGRRSSFESDHSRSMSDEDHTVELGTLQDLVNEASMHDSPSHSKEGSQNYHSQSVESDEEDHTVNLGTLRDLINSSEDSPESKSSTNLQDTTMELGSLSSLARMSSPGPIARAAAAAKSNKNSEDDRTVELGELASLARLSSPGDMSKLPRESEENTVALGELASLARLSSPGPGPVQKPTKSTEDNTVELGELASLARLSSPGPIAEASRRQSEDRTVELGQLSELADISSPENDSMNDDTSKDSTDQSKGSRKSETSVRCNMQAAFDNLISFTPSKIDEANEPKRASGRFSAISQGGLSLPSPSQSQVGSLRKSGVSIRSSTGGGRLDFSKVEATSPMEQPASPVMPQVEEEEDVEFDERAVFQPTNAIPRSPTLECEETMQESVDSEQNNEGIATHQTENSTDEEMIEETSQSPTPMDLDQFLSQANIEFSSIPENLDELVPSTTLTQKRVTSLDHVDREMLQLYSQHLPHTKAMMWACQEILNRVKSTDHTIRQLAEQIVETPPIVLQVAGSADKTELNELSDKMRKLKRVVELQVDLEWYQWRNKLSVGTMEALYLNLQDYNSDCGILETAITSLESEIKESDEMASALEHLASLLSAVEEQENVISGYTNECDQLAVEINELESQVKELTAKHQAIENDGERSIEDVIAASRSKAANPKLQQQVTVLEEKVDALDASLQVAKGLHMWQPVFSNPGTIVFNFFNDAGCEDVENCCKVAVELDVTTEGSSAMIKRIFMLNNNDDDMGGASSFDEQLAGWRMSWFEATVEYVKSNFVNCPTTTLPKFLHKLDLAFGRYSLLLEEVDTLMEAGFPIKLLQASECQEGTALALEYLLVSKRLKAGLNVRVFIKKGYPCLKQSCVWEFRKIDTQGAMLSEDLVDTASRIINEDANCVPGFHYLTRTCRALADMMQKPIH